MNHTQTANVDSKTTRAGVVGEEGTLQRPIIECEAASVCPQLWIRTALVRRENTEMHGPGLVQVLLEDDIQYVPKNARVFHSVPFPFHAISIS